MTHASFRSAGVPGCRSASGSGTATQGVIGKATPWWSKPATFSSDSYFRGTAEGLHLVERFTRTAPDRLTYRMTFTDPTTWASPWTAEMPLKRMDQAIYEFACHEGNHSMVGMLSIARLEETAAGR